MFDYFSPAAIAVREREELVRPHAERIVLGYLRGLLTHDELVAELSELWVREDLADTRPEKCPATADNMTRECTLPRGHKAAGIFCRYEPV